MPEGTIIPLLDGKQCMTTTVVHTTVQLEQVPYIKTQQEPTT